MIFSILVLSGRVQGVGCRSFVRSIATEMGITGTVKNMPGATVCVKCECESEEVLEAFKKKLSKGNFLIRVDKLETKEKKTVEKPFHPSFEIEY